MVLKTLWSKVFKNSDIQTKEQAIKKIKKSGDYDKLLNDLQKVNKNKVSKILNLVAEIMILYMT